MSCLGTAKNWHQKLSSTMAFSYSVNAQSAQKAQSAQTAQTAQSVRNCQNLSSKIFIRNCHQNCHQKLSPKIVIKKCHQKLSSKLSSKIVIKNCHCLLITLIKCLKGHKSLGSLCSVVKTLVVSGNRATDRPTNQPRDKVTY